MQTPKSLPALRRAPYAHDVVGLGAREALANLGGRAGHKIETQTPVLVAGRADADKRQLGIRLALRRSTQLPRAHRARDQLLEARFDHRALATIDVIDLAPIDIDAQDVVSRRSQAGG
jgi:hypothetical protein